MITVTAAAALWGLLAVIHVSSAVRLLLLAVLICFQVTEGRRWAARQRRSA